MRDARLEGNQQHNPSAELLQKLADILDLDLTVLLAYVGVRPASLLPPTRAYFQSKFGISEQRADVLANLLERYLDNGAGGR